MTTEVEPIYPNAYTAGLFEKPKMNPEIQEMCIKGIECANEKLEEIMEMETSSPCICKKNKELQYKLVKIEKLIYMTVMNPNKRQEIFPILLAKFDDIMEDFQDNSKKMVTAGFNTENDYLLMCKASMNLRECVSFMCEYGMS